MGLLPIQFPGALLLCDPTHIDPLLWTPEHLRRQMKKRDVSITTPKLDREVILFPVMKKKVKKCVAASNRNKSTVTASPTIETR